MLSVPYRFFASVGTKIEVWILISQHRNRGWCDLIWHYFQGRNNAQKSRQLMHEKRDSLLVEISLILSVKMNVWFFLKHNKNSLSISDWVSPSGFFQGHLAENSEYCVFEWSAEYLPSVSERFNLQQCFKLEKFMFIFDNLIYEIEINWDKFLLEIGGWKLKKNLHGIRAGCGRKLIFSSETVISRIQKNLCDSSTFCWNLFFEKKWLPRGWELRIGWMR